LILARSKIQHAPCHRRRIRFVNLYIESYSSTTSNSRLSIINREWIWKYCVELLIYETPCPRIEIRIHPSGEKSHPRIINSVCPYIDSVDFSGATMSGGCPSQFTATCLTSVIGNGTLDTRIEYLKQVYSRRIQAYTTAIEKYWVPYGVKYNPCVGGYFLWIQLPDGITSSQVQEESMREGVWIMEGTSCTVPEDSSVQYDKFIRICITLEDEERAVEGIKRIGKVFERLLAM